MNLHIAKLLTLFSLLLYSCTGHDSQRAILDKADRLMDDNPKAALSLLDSIDSPSLTDDRDRAVYALMYSRALDKNYIDVTDDSLINISIDYYADRNDDLYKEMSYYYLACIKCNSRDYAASMKAASEALRIALAITDDRETARAYELMADLYNATYSASRALRYRLLAREYYRKAGLPRETTYAELDLAIAYYNDRQHQRSIALLDSLLELPSGDSLFRAHCLSALVRPLLYTDDYQRAAETATELAKYRQVYTLTGQDYANIEEIHMHNGNLEKAQACIERGSTASAEAIQVDMARYKMHLMEGRHDSMIADYRRMVSRQDRILSEALRHTVTGAELEYADIQTEAATDNTKRARRTGIIIACGLLALTIGVATVARLQLSMKNAEIRKHVNDIREISRQLNDTRTETSRLHDRVDTLFRERFRTLNRLCDQYYEALNAPSPQLQKSVYNNIVKMLTELRCPSELSKLKDIVNEHMNGIIARLESQLPELDADDVAFLTYLYAGFSAKAVCLFTGMSKGNFYVRRRRLRSQIERSRAADSDMFLCRL